MKGIWILIIYNPYRLQAEKRAPQILPVLMKSKTFTNQQYVLAIVADGNSTNQLRNIH
jgi:hypothetical protein